MGMVGVCTCDTVAGDYTFIDGFQPDGQRSLDMGLFQDLDGSAYLVRSVDNKYAGFSKLVSQRHLPPVFSATFRPFCAVFSPFFCGFRLPGAKTERTGEKWRKMGEIWGRNGRETTVAEWRWAQCWTSSLARAPSTRRWTRP